MAGSGKAHLRPTGTALLRVEDLVVEFNNACVYGWRMLENRLAVVAFSTACPAYITMISSVRPATTPRS